ncbi:hypothetical protein, conserved [Babesia bigemina]|uniref:C3H1-type domain-containing protein n=1 Tax=Babesia bigemina TaxID=5866 RepID=A0A061BLD3_BABBI|nr:hypothetical protein, conserved [Babesia bigemina]CDR71686.1 hypothetical protein, conserved [Babesia bigemina]|eukprot:XP_012770632.1 hypothetical protein, conserved [Babesia bigemina]
MQLNKPNNVHNSLPSPSPSADSAKLHSKLEALKEVEKLCNFLTNFKTYDNNPKKLLDNLCDGLQTFLGFDPSSKGYTGQGIVYSDLDRLCDGVMGFLSGVLSNVKEHLGQHKETITTAIKSLETNKHAGKKGFNAAIVKVVAGVGRYNDGVRDSNKNIKNAIIKLQNHVSSSFVNTVKNILPEKDIDTAGAPVIQAAEKFVERKVEECEKNASAFKTSLDSQTDNITNLNSSLRDKVNSVVSSVEHERVRLSKVAAKERNIHEATTVKINEALLKCGSCINEKIQRDVEKLISDFKAAVRVIKDKLEEINKNLKNYVNELYKWMNETNSIVNRTGKNVIEIINGSVGYENQEWIKHKAKELLDWRSTIGGYVVDVTEMAKNVNDAVTELGKQFDDQNTINNIFDKIKHQVADIEGHVGESIGAGSASGADGSVQQNWDALKNKITGLLENLYTTNERDPLKLNFIGKIRKGVTAYAASFKDGDQGFEKIVGEWVTDVIKSKAVHGLLDEYVKVNKNDSYFNGMLSYRGHPALLKRVTEIVTLHVADKLKNIRPSTNFHDTPTVEGYLSYVTSYLNSFSSDITNKEKEIVDTIAEFVHLQPDVVLSDRQAGHRRYYLELAVRSTLSALASIAKQVSDQLTKLAYTHTNLGTRLKGSIANVENIGKEIADGNTLGGKIQAALDSLRSDIKKLHGQLNTATKVGVSNLAGKLDEAIAAITKRSIEVTAEGINTAFTEMYTKITDNLKGLLKALELAGNAIHGQLLTLNDKIGNSTGGRVVDGSLQDLYNRLSELQSTLEKDPLTKARAFEKHADKLREQHTKSLNQHVNNTVKQTKEELIKQARKNYVVTMQLLIEQFAERVTSDLHGLPGLIDADLEQGHKGFMRKVHEYFLLKIDDIESISPTSFTTSSSPMSRAAGMLKSAYADLFGRLKTQPGFVSDFEKIKPSTEALGTLLETLQTSKHFNNEFRTNLDALDTNVNKINPAKYGDGDSPLVLNALRAGFPAFVTEMKKAYKNVYEGAARIDRWTEPVISDQPREATAVVETPKEKLTLDGQNGAKVCLTVFHIIYPALDELDEKSGNSWRSEKINKTGNLGAFFADEGYRISYSETEQNGELDKDVNGGRVKTLLKNKVTGASVMELLKRWKQEENKKNAVGQQTDDAARTQSNYIDTIVLLAYLYEQLRTYYDVCHRRHIPNPVAPTSVYQMLMWLSGLSHNAVYTDLSLNGFEGLFEKPEKSKQSALKDADEDSLEEEEDVSLDAYPNPITVDTLSSNLRDVCGYAETVLTALLGHGHAGGIYACDFNTNSANLSYPSDASKCLDLLMEIVLRLFHQLHFLYKQCTYPMELGGWLNCLYGKGIGGSSWECNKMQCVNQSADQIGNQTCGQTCDQHPKCGVKSPLQAFLEDGLPAFLSHPYNKSGCKITCSYANHKGIPCKTPIGLTDISTMASHTSSASRLYRTLKDFCGNAGSPLTKLCANVTCVLSRPPETLGDMFAFYYTFIKTWGDSGRKHKLDAFNDAVAKAYFDVPYTELNVYSVLNGSHSSKLAGHTNGDLLSLVCGTKSPGKCGLYLSSVSNDISGVYSSKHADKYLSWIVYITETFYDLLKKLFDDCNKHCGGDKPKCRIAKCPSTCTVTKQPTKSDHADSCKSIANCKTTLPTLCRYGFTIGNPSKLSGKDGVSQKRTCNDFCKMLGNVVKEGNALHTLAHEIIPEFLFRIRAPFIWLNVALWLLSFLYLLHIMVIRLDLLHIKSHLRSPSSHRIAAQSLLAAGRVNKLNRVFYLQP